MICSWSMLGSVNWLYVGQPLGCSDNSPWYHSCISNYNLWRSVARHSFSFFVFSCSCSLHLWLNAVLKSLINAAVSPYLTFRVGGLCEPPIAETIFAARPNAQANVTLGYWYLFVALANLRRFVSGTLLSSSGWRQYAPIILCHNTA